MLDLLTGFALLVLGGLLAQFAEIFLPERVRIWFALRKKTLSKWCRNLAYTLGITALLNAREPIDLEAAKKLLKELYAERNVLSSGTELHFLDTVNPGGQINTRVQLGYEDTGNDDKGLVVYSVTITVETQAKYREIRNRIDDLRASLSSAEGVAIKGLSVFPVRRSLYIEVERLEEFSEWLENLEAQQITGKIRDVDAEFVYHGNRLVVEDTINSATIKWIKNIVAHVG